MMYTHNIEESKNIFWCVSAAGTGCSQLNCQISAPKSIPWRPCVQSLALISSLVVQCNTSPSSSEVSHVGIQMSQMNGRTRLVRQWGATGGMGTASGSNRRAPMYFCMPTACPHKALAVCHWWTLRVRGRVSPLEPEHRCASLMSILEKTLLPGSAQHFFCTEMCSTAQFQTTYVYIKEPYTLQLDSMMLLFPQVRIHEGGAVTCVTHRGQ